MLLHLKVSLTPKEYVAESLVSALKDQIAGKRVLLVRAAIARDVIPDALRAAGATVQFVDAYRNLLPVAAPAQLRKAFTQPIDAATFTSSSSVTHLADAAKAAGISFPFEDVLAISIGPITSQTLRDCGWAPAAEADPHDIPGLIAACSSAHWEQFSSEEPDAFSSARSWGSRCPWWRCVYRRPTALAQR